MMTRLMKMALLLLCVVWTSAGCGGDSSVVFPPVLPHGNIGANIVVSDSVAPADDNQVPFGSVQEGASSDQTITVTNSGTADLVIGTAASANPLAAPFTITADTCSGQTIAPSGTCTVSIRFSPAAVNSFTDGFDIPSNDPDASTITISVSGTGTAIPVPNISVTDSVNPNDDLQVPFGSVIQGNTSDQTVTVTNTGTADLVIGTVASVNPLASPFSITTNTCSGQTIAPSGNCSLTIRFAPAAVNLFSDDFDIPSNDPDTSTVTVAVTGTGTPVPAPNISVTDAVNPNDDLQIPFGSVTQGSSADQTVTITNTGNANLVIGTAASANPLAAPFTITADTCSGQTIAPSGTCTVSIRFSPAAVNSFTDGFDIPSNDPDASTITISVSGTGTAAPVPNISVTDSVNPNNDLHVPFGNVIQGNTSSKTVTVTNTGTGSLLIGSVASVNPLAAPFSITADSCSGQTIAPSGTCSLTVRFAPSALNSFNDNFDIPSNDPDTTIVTMTVSGMGVSGTTYQMGGAIQGVQLALTNTVSTVAGVSRIGSQDDTGTAARFHGPRGVTTDGTNLYVTEMYNNTIRRIVISTGVVTTIAGTGGVSGSTDGTGTAAKFSGPSGIATDGTNLYVADMDNDRIRKIVISTGVVTTLAGSGSGSLDGTGTAAQFNKPEGITTDGTNLYVADTRNNKIRQIVISTGVVTTIAGSGSLGNSNGTGSAAAFRGPTGITWDGTALYVSDYGNCSIRKIVVSGGVGTVSSFAGGAGCTSADGTGTGAKFNQPNGIATDGTNLYVADTSNRTIRQIVISSAVVTTLAGTAGSSGYADGTGLSTKFYLPYGIAAAGGNLYIADSSNNNIRQIVITSATVTTFAGTPRPSGGAEDGTGTAATFYNPIGITTDRINLYVADKNNNTIRKIVISSGVVTTFAGTAGSSGSLDGTSTAARFYQPGGITTDGTNLYVADTSNHTIRKIEISSGIVTTFAGMAGSFGSLDGTGTAARFRAPYDITTDGTNLYVADTYNHTIRKIVISSGEVSTLAGTAGSIGSADGTGAAAGFKYPMGITTDGTSLYVGDTYNFTIRKIDISSGVVSTLAGTAGGIGFSDGTGPTANFNYPWGITSDGTNLYVADSSNSKIRKIVISTRVVTTIAGNGAGSTDGPGGTAKFNSPYGITTDGTSLYVTDTYNNSIRKIQ